MIGQYQLAVLLMGLVAGVLGYIDKRRRILLWIAVSAVSLLVYAINWGLNWGAFLMALLLFIDGFRATGLI